MLDLGIGIIVMSIGLGVAFIVHLLETIGAIAWIKKKLKEPKQSHSLDKDT